MGCGSSKNQPTLENVMTANREDSVVRGTSESTSTERRVILPLPAPAHETTKSTLVFDNQDDQLGGMMSGSRFSEDDVESKTPLPPNPPSTAVALPDPKDGISTLPPEVLENMTFCLLHFNDVYHIAPSAKEPVGGAARFAHTVRQYKEQYGADLLFSGDCYNPSLMSTVTRGKHMVPILNELGIRCSVYGNHDFDFGVDVLEELTAGSNSNWLMSNIVDESKGGKPAANGLLTYTFKQKARGWSKDEVTIGVIGCGEEEWLSCVKDLPEAIVYQNAIEVTNREAARLREEGCDFIIALTHMRHNNDLTFTGACPGVDIVLGGHDHFYKSEVLDSGQLLVKSGTDFKNLSFIAVSLPKVGSPSSAGPKQVKYNVERIDITSNIQEDPVVKSVVEGFENSLADKICKEICHLDCEMDISTSHVRTEESGMGNLIADIMKEHCEADCAFVNAGVMRADVVYNAGPITIKDLLDITPIEDIVVSVEITGAQLLGAIENGISKYPQEEGRFLQVSGLEMIGDVLQPAKQRVRQLLINGKQVVPTQTYIAATTAFLCKGCDGFDIMKGSKYVIDPENGPVLPTLVRKAIESMVAPDVKAMRKSSVRHARRSLGGKENVESKEAVEHVKRAYLPHICPRVEGRLRLMQGPQDAEDDPFSKAEKTGDAMMPPADPTGSHNPMGVVQKDVESVKSAFAAHKEHIPTTNVHWSDALLPYLGQTGTIINIITSEVSLTQLRFADKVAHWFPSRIVIDVVREDSQSVTNDKDSVHQPPGRVNSMVPKIRDRMNSQTRATPAAMVPNVCISFLREYPCAFCVEAASECFVLFCTFSW